MTRNGTENSHRALYAKPSVFSTYTDVIQPDRDPGPGQYYPQLNSFGAQRLSHHRTQPSAIILGKHHVPSMKSTPPGQPAPEHVSEFNSDIGNGRASIFAHSLRPDLADQMGVEKSSPGPVYDVRNHNHRTGISSVGPQIGFTRSDRFRSRGVNPVGPGEYASTSSMDRLLSSRFSFGMSHRAFDKVKRPGGDAECMGRESQGPGDPLWSDIAKQGSRAHSFSVGARFADNSRRRDTSAGGPGAYDIQFARSTSCSSVFGSPPRKSRLNHKALLRCTDRVWGVV